MKNIQLSHHGRAILYSRGAKTCYDFKLSLSGGFVANTDAGEIAVTREEMQNAITLSRLRSNTYDQPLRHWEHIEWLLR